MISIVSPNITRILACEFIAIYSHVMLNVIDTMERMVDVSEELELKYSITSTKMIPFAFSNPTDKPVLIIAAIKYKIKTVMILIIVFFIIL